MNVLKTINIFRSGTHTAMGGQTLTYSEQDISLMAAAYNETARPAPLVLGHPEHDDPAYGVVKSLFAKAGVLYAIASVSAALIALVKAGQYNNVSAAFVAPTGPGNPAPGAWYLRHVGFLGALAPAVKGLDPIAFAEGAPVFFGSSNAFSYEGAHLDASFVDLSYVASEVSFAEAQQGMTPYQRGREALHQTALRTVAAHPEISYYEAACMLERRF